MIKDPNFATKDKTSLDERPSYRRIAIYTNDVVR